MADIVMVQKDELRQMLSEQINLALSKLERKMCEPKQDKSNPLDDYRLLSKRMVCEILDISPSTAERRYGLPWQKHETGRLCMRLCDFKVYIEENYPALHDIHKHKLLKNKDKVIERMCG